MQSMLLCAEVVNLNVFVSVSHSWPDRPKVKRMASSAGLTTWGATQGIRRGKNDPISRAHGLRHVCATLSADR